MKKALLFVLFPLSLFANDLGTWNTIQIQKKMPHDLSIGASEESRIGTVDSDKRLDEFHTTAFLDWRVFDWMSVGVQDDFVLLRRSGAVDRYRRDNRPGINLTFRHSVGGFDFSNRSRFIMRDLENERPYFRYRNLSKVTMPRVFNVLEREVRPYVSYEWYFDEGSKDREIRKNDKFGQFWTDFGLQTRISPSCSLCLFYRLVELKVSESWQPSHVVGTAFTLSF
jgi:hypothetical protein